MWKKSVMIMLVVGLAMVGVAFTLHCEEKNITVITEDFAPLNFVENGKLQGPSVEIVQNIMKKLGITNKINVYPWKRGYMLLEKHANTCLFSTTRTEKREKQFKWVGPLAIKKYGFLAKKSSHIKIKKLDEAKKYKVGGQRGGVSEEFLRKNNFKKIDLATTPAQNLEKLNVGRYDLWYTSSATASKLINEKGLNPDDFEMVYVVKQAELYIAFNKNTSDDIIKAWQGAYDELYKNGTIKKIFEKYHDSSLYPEH